MDQRMRHPSRDKGTAPECGSCRAARRAVAQDASCVDDDVVVISRAELGGLLVVPRQHISGIEELPVAHRARVLAALQRAKHSVREQNPQASAEIVVTTDSRASDGHVCFEVLPTDPGDSKG